MAIWPSNVEPDRMSRKRIAPYDEFVSPFTKTTQSNGSASHLWEVSYVFPVLDPSQARRVEVCMTTFEKEDLIIRLHQPNFVTTGAGAVAVAAGATGFTLPVSGVTAGYAFLAGQFISVFTTGRNYTYMLAADSPAGATTRSLTLTSVILAPHTTGNTVEVSEPVIQGQGYGEMIEADDGVNYKLTSLRVRQRK